MKSPPPAGGARPSPPPARRQRDRVFPAHLAPIDRFLLDDDGPTHPMTCVIRLDCRGVWVRGPLEEALAGAVERHPYTRAVIGPGKGGRLSWVDGGGRRPAVDWGLLEEPLALPDGEPIDIRNQVGVRVWVRQDATHSRLLLQWHHAVSDGTGALRFIGDLLALYDQAAGGAESRLLPLQPGLLRERRTRMAGHFGRGDGAAVRAAAWRVVRGVLARPAAALAKPRRGVGAGGAGGTFPGYSDHTLDRTQTVALRAAADAATVTLNDLLVERVFQSLRDWNTRHGRRKPRRPLRVMMPADMRQPSEAEMPAANMVSYNFLTRRSSECDDPAALLRGVANETDRIKHARTGEDFIDAISAGEAAPWLAPWLLRRGLCLATTVFTNNGDPSRRMTARLPRVGGKLSAGGVVVERFSGVPPLRPQTRVAVAAMTYARRLTLSVRCDPNHYSDGHSEEFLALLRARLAETIAAADGH